jgi:hypothetical protein
LRYINILTFFQLIVTHSAKCKAPQRQVFLNKGNPILFCTSFEKTGRILPWVMAQLAAIIIFCASLKYHESMPL